MYKKRNLYKRIWEHIPRKEYTIITGARQVGKTTLLQQIYKNLKKDNARVYFISFENPDILHQVNDHPDNIFKYVDRPADILTENDKKDRVYLLIDEIQYAKNPTNLLKYLFDKYGENLKVLATGSSAFYLDTKFKDSLAGRKMIFNLFSLSFDEFLVFKEKNDLIIEYNMIKNSEEYISSKNHELYDMLDEYLVYGGYPAVVLEPDPEFKREKLFELRNAFVKRDLLESGIKNETAFYRLMTLIAGQIGNLVNKNELSATINVDNKTVENYIHILQKCFHITLIKPFYNNLRKELSKMPKVYFNDLGLRNVLLNRFLPMHEREDKGSLFENFVFKQLVQKYPVDHVKFWRTADGNEVDFVINESFGKDKAIEVKFSNTRFSDKKYKKFTNLYPNINFQVVSYRGNNGSISALKI